MEVALMRLSGGHGRQVIRDGLEHRVAWLASFLGSTERAR
jgi:hypothetical protein